MREERAGDLEGGDDGGLEVVVGGKDGVRDGMVGSMKEWWGDGMVAVAVGGR